MEGFGEGASGGGAVVVGPGGDAGEIGGAVYGEEGLGEGDGGGEEEGLRDVADGHVAESAPSVSGGGAEEDDEEERSQRRETGWGGECHDERRCTLVLLTPERAHCWDVER